jgi:hypothetical protein
VGNQNEILMEHNIKTTQMWWENKDDEDTHIGKQNERIGRSTPSYSFQHVLHVQFLLCFGP